MSSQTLVAVLLLFAILDVVLVALPCCSPVQKLDKLTWDRGMMGEPQMPYPRRNSNPGLAAWCLRACGLHC